MLASTDDGRLLKGRCEGEVYSQHKDYIYLWQRRGEATGDMSGNAVRNQFLSTLPYLQGFGSVV
ncbi:hypothetical protein MIDIC_200002 [Alphaproteobacteria bacterium]